MPCRRPIPIAPGRQPHGHAKMALALLVVEIDLDEIGDYIALNNPVRDIARASACHRPPASGPCKTLLPRATLCNARDTTLQLNATNQSGPLHFS